MKISALHILTFLLIALSGATTKAEVHNPDVLVAPVRTFIISKDFDSDSGSPLKNGDSVKAKDGYYLCAETKSSQTLLFSPPATSAEGYILVSLTENGSAAQTIKPDALFDESDAFLRMPGMADVVCRMMSDNGADSLSVGVESRLVGEYAWEDYEESLKDWAHVAALSSARPSEPPSSVISSMSDRLWFLSEWLKHSGYTDGVESEKIEKVLMRAAMWEVLRSRPLDTWAYSSKDLSEEISTNCMDIAEPEDVSYCHDQDAAKIDVEGPGVLLLRYRPEVRQEPTPVLEDALLQVIRDGEIIYSDPVPVYPDHLQYDSRDFQVSADPLLTNDGHLLGRRGSLKVLVPEGKSRIEFKFERRGGWWSVMYSEHLRHVEDASCGEELLTHQSLQGTADKFDLLVAAEEAYRLGLCKQSELAYSKLLKAGQPSSTALEVIGFRKDNCKPEGEILTPESLSDAFALLGMSVSPDSLQWEDRRGELFRLQQVQKSLMDFEYKNPGMELENIVRAGEASSAQKIALSALWYLDSIWSELEVPPEFTSEKISIFQERKRYPEIEALPGGISLMEVADTSLMTSSRLFAGVSRAVTLVSQGSSGTTDLDVDGRRLRLSEVLPVQKYEILLADHVEVSKLSGDRRIWLQQRISDRDIIAQAKLVQAWEIDKQKVTSFELPDEGYSGYALLQVFPPADLKHKEKLVLNLESCGIKKSVDFSFRPQDKYYDFIESGGGRLGLPLAETIELKSNCGSIGVSFGSEAEKPEGEWYARVLLRLPRPFSESLLESEFEVPVDLSPEEKKIEVGNVLALSQKLTNAKKTGERAGIFSLRAESLCKLNRSSLASEDLLRASSSENGVDRELLLELREKIETGFCKKKRSESWRVLPLSTGVVVDDKEPENIRELRQRFIREVYSGNDFNAMEICESLVLDEPRHLGCLPWYVDKVWLSASRLNSLPERFFEMLVSASAFHQKTHWGGLDKAMGRLWGLSHWEPVEAVEEMSGIETIRLENGRDFEEAPGEYASIVNSLNSRHDSLPVESWVLSEGTSIKLHLPAVEPVNVYGNFSCLMLSPSKTLPDEECKLSVLLDGKPHKELSLHQGYVGEVELFKGLVGDHLIEVNHRLLFRPAKPLVSLSLASDHQLKGIPQERGADRYYFKKVGEYSMYRADYSAPVSFHIYGPTVLRVEAFDRKGARREADVKILDEEGLKLEPIRKQLIGFQDIWLDKKQSYRIEISSANEETPVLLRMYFRELNGQVKAELKQLSESLLAVKDQERYPDEIGKDILSGKSLLITEGGSSSYDTDSLWGTGSFEFGYRRLMRDETGDIDPVDSYLFTSADYLRRLEGWDVWLGIGAEGRLRFSGNDSAAFDGSFYWITPGPELEIELSDRFAIQDVGTGIAGGNRANFEIKRGFEVHPKLKLTPGIGAFHKWQGIDEWREDQIQDYTDMDVYSPYGRDHPYGLKAFLGLYYSPWINNGIFGKVSTQTNSDFYTLDHVAVRVGDKMAFKRFQGLVFYDIRTRFDDNDRNDFSLRHQLHAGGSYSWWPHEYVRLALKASYDFYPHELEHGAYGGFLIELSPARGLRDKKPGDEAFPWQVDPMRYWVREW